MKILSIGNSFSQDAHRWLHTLSLYGGTEIDSVNLYIGGCGTCEKARQRENRCNHSSGHCRAVFFDSFI